MNAQENKYVTKAELDELKNELIAELKNTEIDLKERGNGQLFKPIYNKWFHNPTQNWNINTNKPFKKIFGIHHNFEVWNAVRALVCMSCGSKTVAGINDTHLALDFCEKLCEFIFNYFEARNNEGTKVK